MQDMKDSARIQEEELSFTSGGRRIGIQAWRSQRAYSPAVLVLRGAGGADAGNRYISHMGRAVATQGFDTFLVEYFDRTGTTYATETLIKTNGPAWLETIHDAIDFLSSREDVDTEHIGMFGYSLGGYLAVAQAARDERVKAIVELAGGVDAETAAGVRRLPPMLIVHGREDQRVSFTNALELQSLCEKLHTPVQTLFLPGERHLLSAGAGLVAVRQALHFFDAHLRCSNAALC
ncbi:dienelactone hydrolase [Chthoniobacter flavus Ellin428]|uniref:Dienelactone hydrolase n=2 Tax=Chthoniobacter flavus TaxID=191863 RepID=B4D8T2_9BACT|nr:dienelactone hydrolase [Chthoniobacter flavus Ellin428]